MKTLLIIGILLFVVIAFGVAIIMIIKHFDLNFDDENEEPDYMSRDIQPTNPPQPPKK